MAEREKLESGDIYAKHDQSEQLDLGIYYQLVYLSTSLLPLFDSGGKQDILAILNVSRENNKRHDITGALIFNERHFAQVLEGSRANVGDVFRSIQKDRRHIDIVVLQEGWIKSRDFGGWAMAYFDESKYLHTISTESRLENIIKQRESAGVALIEMMKYLLKCTI